MSAGVATAPTVGLRRHRRREPFVQIPSSTMRDRRLSFKARGLLGYILDLPDGWDVRSDHLAAQSDRDGITAVRSALHELAACGYYRLERRLDPVTRKFTMGTAISETPVPEWAAEYAEFGALAVPVVLQPDGTYVVVRKDPPPPPDGQQGDAPERQNRAHGDTPGTESACVAPEPPGSGFPSPGNVDSGFCDAVEPRALIRQNTQTEKEKASFPNVRTDGDPRVRARADARAPLAKPVLRPVPMPAGNGPNPPAAAGDHHSLAMAIVEHVTGRMPGRIHVNQATRNRAAAEVVKKLRGGWWAHPGTLESLLGDGWSSARDAGALVARIRRLPAQPPALPAATATLALWCGDPWRGCSPGSPMIENGDGTVRPCPECRELRRAARAAREAASA